MEAQQFPKLLEQVRLLYGLLSALDDQSRSSISRDGPFVRQKNVCLRLGIYVLHLLLAGVYLLGLLADVRLVPDQTQSEAQKALEV